MTTGVTLGLIGMGLVVLYLARNVLLDFFGPLIHFILAPRDVLLKRRINRLRSKGSMDGLVGLLRRKKLEAGQDLAIHFALGDFGDAAISTVCQLLKDPSPVVRRRAAEALAHLASEASEKAWPALRQALGDSGGGDSAAAAAIVMCAGSQVTCAKCKRKYALLANAVVATTEGLARSFTAGWSGFLGGSGSSRDPDRIGTAPCPVSGMPQEEFREQRQQVRDVVIALRCRQERSWMCSACRHVQPYVLQSLDGKPLFQ